MMVVRWRVLAIPVAVAVLSGCTGETAEPVGAPEPSSVQPSAATSAPSGIVESVKPNAVRVLTREAPEVETLEAGRYAVWLTPELQFEVDVPDRWEVVQGRYFSPSDESAHVGGILGVVAAPDVTSVAAHPCRDHTWHTLGSSARDLADALAAQPYVTVSRPVPVSVGAFRGWALTYTVPADADLAACEGGTAAMYNTDRARGPTAGWQAEEAGLVALMRIVDVGDDRYVVQAFQDLGDPRPRAAAAILRRLVASVRFVDPG
jgi:hypothetical protein